MNRKKIIVLISCVFVTCLVIIFAYNKSFNKNKHIEEIKENSSNKVPDMVSIMLETGVDTNKYELSSSNEYPTSKYEFNSVKSGCENGGTLTWNDTTNKLVLKTSISDKCYAYFDVLPPDVAVNISNRPTTYGKLGSINCTNGSATYNQQYNRIEVSSINDYSSCNLNYTDSTSKVNLADYIISLTGTTQGTGQVVNENGQIVKSYTDGNKLILSEYKNYVNDENYPFVWDSTNLTWKSDIDSDGTELDFELSEGEYKICYKSNIDNYDGDISIGNFYADSFTTSFQCEIATNAYDSSGSIIYVSNNNVGNGYIEFYLQKVTLNYEQINAGIRYEGKNPNNYIWFNNEYWRIIGVFDSASHGVSGKNLVKIIRADVLDGLAWNKSNTNDWTVSSLKSLLNGAYYNAQDGTNSGYCYGYSTTATANCDYTKRGIQSGYRGMIANVTWHLGGYSSSSATAEAFYGYERGTTVYSGRPTSTTGYIGLMYPSDYGYSVLSSSCARTTYLDSYGSGTCEGQSWLYGKGDEWTLTPFSSSRYNVFHLYSVGIVSYDYADTGFSSRPVLYLDASVYKIDGDGSQKNPYIVGM